MYYLYYSNVLQASRKFRKIYTAAVTVCGPDGQGPEGTWKMRGKTAKRVVFAKWGKNNAKWRFGG
jgi:hypothetical protein